MKKILFTFLLLVLIAMLAACSDDKETVEKTEPNEDVSSSEPSKEDDESESELEENPDDEQDEIIVDPLPKTLSELAELSSGFTERLSISDKDDQVKIDELTANLPDISGEPTETQLDHYYNELLAVFQQSFLGPENLIAKMKFQSMGNPDIENPRMQFKEKMNVLVLLDGSGSMAVDIGGQTQMEAAKEAIRNFMDALPDDANVGLRTYGHKGSGSSADREMSCASSELIYPIQAYDKVAFNKSLDQVQPAGWTPTELAIRDAKEDLASFDGATNTNIVYLVSDGISTCDDDPVAAAKDLYESDITPIINVIGFNVDNEGQKQLKEVAKAVEGTYQNVQDSKTLQDELNQANELAKKWTEWKENKEASLNSKRLDNKLDIFSYDVHEFGKLVDERQQVGFVLQYLFQKKEKMSKESYDYLSDRHIDYHKWILDEYEELKRNLREANELEFTEAIEALEEKYLKNTPD
ncbi:VWA domain-containing protein [Sporosarcina sp. Sa2YVA2]|uniref:VWA domain-containing protein n=1 Tax=Sporosarcina quadrami TaxID=2762234 RepID=A0ABR8U9P1_9BACL|nr:VWA domain-containing protein [Sporosarcina quadrami]MBD7984759.1 VWA domain-containing protein [Sporosarcina quadrami]